MFAAPAATAETRAAPVPWQPQERSVSINYNLSSPEKIEELRRLAGEMSERRQLLDKKIADLNRLRTTVEAVQATRKRLDWQLMKLKSDISYYTKEAKKLGEKILIAKAEFPIFRNQMTLRALQSWLWTYERDNIVIPAVEKFLAKNGVKFAVKHGLTPVVRLINEAGKLSFEKLTDIRGTNELLAVEREVVGLLNPTKSRILQAAEFNARITSDEAAAFADEVQEELGQHYEDLVVAAGVKLSPPYQGLFKRLMRE